MQRAAFMGARHDVVQLVSGAATSLESVAQVEVFKTGPQRKVAAQQIHSVHTARIGKDDVILRWASATRTYPVHVVAHAAVQGVDGTVTASTVEAPVARREHVVPVAADDAVRPVAAVKSVVPGEAVDHVVAVGADERIVAVCPDEMNARRAAASFTEEHDVGRRELRSSLEDSDHPSCDEAAAVPVVPERAAGGVVHHPIVRVMAGARAWRGPEAGVVGAECTGASGAEEDLVVQQNGV